MLISISVHWKYYKKRRKSFSKLFPGSPEVKVLTSKLVCIFSHKPTQPDVKVKLMWEVDLSVFIRDDLEISFK